MSQAENASSTLGVSPQQPTTVDAISDGLSKVSLPKDPSLNPPSSPTTPQSQTSPQTRPFVMYSRSQILFLHKSPLVKVPSGMPALKDWFGIESDQINAKKDSEIPMPPSNTRDRRFRRDGEDGTLRTSFRGTGVTQPSQMGNFKHQSIRGTDRDRDRDVDREQERDIRLKEGQERLRNLSDKYDRDRRALSSLSQMRPKDRESAPHLMNANARAPSQGQQMVSARTTDVREPLRKKDGETSDDWRKGVEQARTSRDRPENVRRDRDDRDRDRPRSRVRDSSKSRRDSSLTRRERDDRQADRDDGSGTYRRDRDERDRDFDRDSEADDPRRWRDDGRRDERMAARRERENRERERDRDVRDRTRDKPSTWEGADRSDRRWLGDDRDNRGKRPGGRDRRDDTKDRDDRKDREREKEPAWMETYIPSTSGGGVLGGQRAVGELDGIQAFKKELREREQKDRLTSTVDLASGSHAPAESPDQPLESQLDEIQLFKLMMKREEEKKKLESSLAPHSPSPSQNAPSADVGPQDNPSRLNPNAPSTPSPPIAKGCQAPSPSVQEDASGPSDDVTQSPMSGLAASSPQLPNVTALARKESDTVERLKPAHSRLFTATLALDSNAPQAMGNPPTETLITSTQVPQAHPSSGSRLLALGSRTPQNPIGSSTVASKSPVSFSQRNGVMGLNQVVGGGLNINSLGEPVPQVPPTTDDQRPRDDFSPFEERSGSAPTITSESSSRNSMAFGNDRNVFVHGNNEQPTVEPGLGTGVQGMHSTQTLETVNVGVAAAKGSRFAKFFDKGKDNLGGIGKNGATVLGSNAQKMDLGGLLPPNNPDARAMDDIFAMLNNSAHAQRLNTAPDLLNLDIGPYGSSSANPQPLQNPRPHVAGHSRVDSLYDSRLDDRNFMPDGMVPGLRSVAPPRSRQNSAMFSELPEDPIQFNSQRGSAPLFQSPIPSIHLSNNAIGRGGIPIQPAQYRGGPSPNPLGSAQRLPPGLANLGGRPPHEPNQFVNSVGMTNGGIHGPLHGTGPAQQPFNAYQQAAGLGFSGGTQMRVPHPAGPHQLPGPLGPNSLQGLVHPGHLGSSQAQLLGLAGVNGVPAGLRGPNGVFGQQGPQVQPPQVGLRQHQLQQQIPPHMLPLHMQHQGFGGGASNQPDLMSLLMNGGRRD